jgi:ribosomal-protein-alanine N-acetyltransferase
MPVFRSRSTAKTMSFPEQLHSSRLVLRTPVEADAPNVFNRYGQDPLVCKYMSWIPHKTVDDTREFLYRCNKKEAANPLTNYLIFAKDSGQLLGSVGGSVQSSRVQFGYCLARDAWGKGFATEAATAFVDAAMRQPDIWRIQAYCDVENRASARVLEKVGLTFEGTLRRYMVLPNLGDVPRDVHCYARVRD